MSFTGGSSGCPGEDTLTHVANLTGQQRGGGEGEGGRGGGACNVIVFPVKRKIFGPFVCIFYFDIIIRLLFVFMELGEVVHALVNTSFQ